MMEYNWDMGVNEGDFAEAFGRKPKDKEEFETFGRYCRKGVNSQLDWDIIRKCAKEAMEK